MQCSGQLNGDSTNNLDRASFRRFRDIAYQNAGIVIKPGKEALVSARIAKRMRALGLNTARGYLRFLEKDDSGEELVNFLDVISTNFTSFFREQEHFDIFSRAVRKWINKGRPHITVWSAASSSGEEPYSIAFTLAELQEQLSFEYRILATDISTKVLYMAGSGLYKERSLAPLSRSQRSKFFAKLRGRREELCYKVRPHIRSRVVFSRLNLADPPYPMHGPFDAIFCRNVMIYFDIPVRQRLLAEINRLLKPGGMLFVGHAETLTGLQSSLMMCKPSVYQRHE